MPGKCSIKKVFLKIWQNSQSSNFIKKETPTSVISGEFCEIFKNTFFIEHLRWLPLSKLCSNRKYLKTIQSICKLGLFLIMKLTVTGTWLAFLQSFRSSYNQCLSCMTSHLFFFCGLTHYSPVLLFYTP